MPPETSNDRSSSVELRAIEGGRGPVSTHMSRRDLLLQLELTAQFHATLDLGALINSLAQLLERELGASNVAYAHPLQSVTIQLGANAAPHFCEYRLERNGSPLGTVRLGRCHPFARRHVERIETILTCFVPALRNALEHRAARQAATKDELTGCGNRAALELCAAHEIAQARRYKGSSVLLVIDCDHFKRINDTHGHLAGDCVLAEMGRVLRDNCRESDGVFRYGGEEFVMLLGQTPPDAAAAVAERIRAAIQAMVVRYRGEEIPLTTSIGGAALGASDCWESWFTRADQALYQAKASGRNCVEFYRDREAHSA